MSVALQNILKNSVILKAANHSATIIFCHGLGDVPDGWADVMEMVQEKNSHIKFILPAAPTQPVTLNGGYKMPSWYDIKTLSERGNEDKDDVDKSKNAIETIIQSEIDAGTPSDRILIGGFSQGAALSLYTYYQTTHKLAGCVALSGYLPLAPIFPTLMKSTNKSQPLFMAHGQIDPVVKYAWGEKSFNLLKENGATGEFVTYNYMGHSSSPEEIRDLTAFITKTIPKL